MAKRKKLSSKMPNGSSGVRSPHPASAPPSSYRHPEAALATRPEIGTQSQFRKKKPPKSYKYDSSLSPQMEWDGQNPAREHGERLINEILSASSLEVAKESAQELARISKPFLNWAGKSERLSFDVPTLPLFVHERLSTQAILETLKRHKSDKQTDMFELFADPQRSITDQVLKAYEHRDKWVNRLILGDSLVVMNSLLQYEGLGEGVQMVYIDPPYGVRFGSNFQPFVRKRDVKHNDDTQMTREPEMVQAYRDTWELGLHSYLTYLRDRLLVARDLLSPTGSVFVQISDENVHHVRELMDEVFGPSQFCSLISFRKTTSTTKELLPTVNDLILWYAKDVNRVRYRELFTTKRSGEEGATGYTWVEMTDGTRRKVTQEEQSGMEPLPDGSRIFALTALLSPGFRTNTSVPYKYNGVTFDPGPARNWKTTISGLDKLAAENRLHASGHTLNYVRYLEDFPLQSLTNVWSDTWAAGYAEDKSYVVQTSAKVIQRCMLMTTEPGELVLDPTCGSGTTAYVAEHWGRRWISIDTSRVPLALSRQRLLTSSFDWFELADGARGPSGGFVYKRRENTRGEAIGGIVPHITLKSVANSQPPTQEIRVDLPERDTGVTRVSGPFVVEATIPTPVDFEGDGIEDAHAAPREEYGSFIDRMIEVLRKSPRIQLPGNQAVALKNVRPAVRSLSLSAEAMVDASAPGQAPSLSDVIDEAEEKRGDRLPLSMKPVAIVFGPENGAVSEKLVFNAAKEANAKGFAHLYVIGFAIEPNARTAVESSQFALGIPATYVQATPDILMGDLLKTMRSSQIFSVCGLPEVRILHAKKRDKSDPEHYQVQLLGVDVFDPITMKVESIDPDAVPAWFLDSDYNGLCFHVSQAFFPNTKAWENLKRDLRADFDESVWAHLNGTTSAEIERRAPDQQIAVKVIDHRGNELLVTKSLKEVSG